jgi:signal transduction histidine kinase
MAKDKLMESYANSAIGNLYEKWNDGKNALTYYLVSYKIREQVGDTNELVSSLIETARAYDRMKQHDKQNEMVDRALKMAEQKANGEQNLVYLYQMKGYDYFDRLKDYKKALEYFLKSYNIVAKNNSFDKNNINSIKPIAETYLKLGDYKNASDYYKLYVELRDANQKKLDKELFESQFVLKKEVERQKFLLKDSEILTQKVELQKQANIRNLFIAGSFILLILIFLIYRNNGLKQRSNIILEEKVKERTYQLDTLNNQLKTEINERKKAEENLNLSEVKLIEINKELESFIYRASHDLKGPLSSSRGLINLALNAKDTEDILKFLSMIATSLDKLDNILVDLHELTIIRQGTIRIKEIEIVDIINDLLGNFKGYENYNRIKFSIDNKLTSGFHTDEILIKTIMRNVLENAIKYSRANLQDSFVNVLIKEEGSYHLIKVTDNGIGILPEFQNKVFDVFIRANDVTKGSGLGLYIAKNAITKLAGKIEIESSNVNQGTTMNLFFPKNFQASA